MSYQYTSPSRPLDTGWIPDKEVGDSFDIDAWLEDAKTLGFEWTPTRVYTFGKALPEDFVDRWGLKSVHRCEQCGATVDSDHRMCGYECLTRWNDETAAGASPTRRSAFSA
jgi:hypothetical protein